MKHGVLRQCKYVGRAECLARMVRLADVIAAYAVDHDGRYPASLDELTPKYVAEIPRDPFTGSPIGYQPRKNGFLLTSPGPNGKQNDPRGRVRHMFSNVDTDSDRLCEEYPEAEEGDDSCLIIWRDSDAEKKH